MNQTAFEMLKMIREAKAVLPQIKTPFYCIHGSADEIAYPTGSQYLFDNSGTEIASKQIEIFPDLLHEMMHEKEPERTEVSPSNNMNRSLHPCPVVGCPLFVYYYICLYFFSLC
jgi:esterase/lipase